jgi:hypothetical protein
VCPKRQLVEKTVVRVRRSRGGTGAAPLGQPAELLLASAAGV